MIKAFYSDPHFGHRRIIEHSERPYASLNEMHRDMIARYNAVVRPGDVCLWAGDCFLCPLPEAQAIMDRLNGYKMTVLGNHDHRNRLTALGFSVVAEELFLRIADRRARVKHYPHWREPQGKPVDRHGRPMDDARIARAKASAPPKVPGEVLIHGHTHSSSRGGGNAIHVGVDAWDYGPVPAIVVEDMVVG